MWFRERGTDSDPTTRLDCRLSYPANRPRWTSTRMTLKRRKERRMTTKKERMLKLRMKKRIHRTGKTPQTSQRHPHLGFQTMITKTHQQSHLDSLHSERSQLPSPTPVLTALHPSLQPLLEVAWDQPLDAVSAAASDSPLLLPSRPSFRLLLAAKAIDPNVPSSAKRTSGHLDPPRRFRHTKPCTSASSRVPSVRR